MVKLFVTPSCPYCVTLKKFLQENQIQFKEVDVSENQTERDEMIKRSGQMGVPVLDIDGEIVVGFDKKKINELLNLED